MALDWTESVSAQLNGVDILECDYVVAVDTVWLTDLLEPFVRTMSTILESPRRPIGILSFKDRYTGTDTFTPVTNVKKQFESRGFSFERSEVNLKEDSEYHQKHVYLVRKL